jgi:hypothetical protein
MPALPPKADIGRAAFDVRFAPRATIRTRSKAAHYSITSKPPPRIVRIAGVGRIAKFSAAATRAVNSSGMDRSEPEKHPPYRNRQQRGQGDPYAGFQYIISSGYCRQEQQITGTSQALGLVGVIRHGGTRCLFMDCVDRVHRTRSQKIEPR